MNLSWESADRKVNGISVDDYLRGTRSFLIPLEDDKLVEMNQILRSQISDNIQLKRYPRKVLSDKL